MPAAGTGHCLCVKNPLVVACTVAGVLVTPLVAAPAAGAVCPDVEIVFARGTGEPPGVGTIGQAFVDAVRAQAPDRSVQVYPVAYLASDRFDDRIEFARSVVDGIRDAGARVTSTVAACPQTRIVLGGYSQGAVVAGFVTAAAVPESVPAEAVPAPLPPEIADHVAAVALFGMPSAGWMNSYGAPPVVVGPRYADRTIQLCVPGDTVCDGEVGALPSFAHMMYGANGMTRQAADFAVNRF